MTLVERPAVRVIYEDRRGDQNADMALHKLLLRCVNDRLPRQNPTVLHHLVAHATPKNVGNALKAFSNEGGPSGEFLIALLDRDRLPEHLPGGLAKAACRQQIFQSVLSIRSPRTKRRELVLLEQNLESLLCHLEPKLEAALQPVVHDACSKGRGSRISRDVILAAASSSPELRRHVVLFPSFGRLVDAVVRQLPAAESLGS